MELGVIFWPWSWMTTASVIFATVCIGLFKGLFELPRICDAVLLTRGIKGILNERMARCTGHFTISFFGRKHMVLSSPDAINFVLMSGHASFERGYPKHVMRLLDGGKIVDLPMFKKLVLAKTTGEGLQNHLPVINTLAEDTVKSWEKMARVDVADEARKFSFKVGMHMLWADIPMDSEEMEEITKDFDFITRAWLRVPINLPGFALHKAMKARNRLISRIQSSISRRRQAESKVNDLLNALMSIPNSEVTDYDRSCVIVALLFASYTTTTEALSWILKYLHDFPKVCQRVQNEQDSVRQMVVEDKLMTSFKLKSIMPYTLQVINEVMRLEALLPLIPRQTMTNVDYNGLVFPKGTIVWTALASSHHNPKIYSNPQDFDPSRFEEKPKANTFIPFGQGMHSCPGKELALSEMLLMIHHLVIDYNWERCEPNQGESLYSVRRLVGGLFIYLVKR